MNCKKRILIYNVGFSNDSIYPNIAFKQAATKLDIECHLYNGSEQEIWQAQNRHFERYSGFLEEAFSGKYDIAYFDYIVDPEYLLAELQARKFCHQEQKIKIVFSFNMRGSARSFARAMTYVKLIEHSYVDKVLIYSLIGKEMDLPNYWKYMTTEMSKVNLNKIRIIYEPELGKKENFSINKKEAKKLLGIPIDKEMFLFFGRTSFVKGLDIFIKAATMSNLNATFYIKTYGENLSNFLPINDHYFVYDNKFCSDKYIGIYFRAADYVVLPYRKQYKYGGSGPAKLAMLAKRPLIVPNFTPFKDLVNNYKSGITFDQDNPDSLKNAMKKIRYYSFNKENTLFDLYNKKVFFWEEIVEEVVK